MITTRRVLVLTPKADWEVILLVVVVVVVVSEKNMKMPVASRVLPVINGKGDLKMDDNDGEFEHLPRPLWLRKDDKGKEVLCLFSWRAPIDRWTRRTADLDCHLFYKDKVAPLKTKCHRELSKTTETTLNTDILMMLDIRL